MNIYKFFRPNISEFFVGNLIEDSIALDLITNKEVDVSNCDKSEIDLFSNQHIIDSLEKYFLANNKFIFKFIIPYQQSPNVIGFEYFGFKIYNIDDNTSKFDYESLKNIMSSNLHVFKDSDEYVIFKSRIFLEYLPIFNLNHLIDKCLSYDILSHEELKKNLILNLESIQ